MTPPDAQRKLSPIIDYSLELAVGENFSAIVIASILLYKNVIFASKTSDSSNFTS